MYLHSNKINIISKLFDKVILVFKKQKYLNILHFTIYIYIYIKEK